MNVLTLVLRLLCCVSLVLAVCPVSPSHWCDSDDIAQKCGVSEQCHAALRRERGADPVNLTLYFESECPDCKLFTSKQLTPVWQKLGADVLNVTLVPYGNAKEHKGLFKWVFVCQHGPSECVGNLIEAVWRDGDPEKDAEKCATKHGIDIQPVFDCANGKMGNELEHEMALRTAALNPPHQYVPWITINGVHTEPLQDKAESDLLTLVCETYKGPTPEACQQTDVRKTVAKEMRAP